MRRNLASQSLAYHVFAHSDFGLDALQCRVFTHLLEQLNGREDRQPIRARIEDIMGLHASQHNFTLLEEALQDLAGKRLTKPNVQRTGLGFYPLFEYLTFHQEAGGSVEAVFSPHTLPELLELTRTFSLQEIAGLVMLRHSHSQRLFWYLRPYVGERRVELSVEELKEVMLGVRKYRQRDAEYERYYDFKTRVVDQAIKALRDRGLLDIRYREYRHKRVVVKLVLKVNYCRTTSPATSSPAQLMLFS